MKKGIALREGQKCKADLAADFTVEWVADHLMDLEDHAGDHLRGAFAGLWRKRRLWVRYMTKR